MRRQRRRKQGNNDDERAELADVDEIVGEDLLLQVVMRIDF